MNYDKLYSFYKLPQHFPNIDFIFFDSIDSTNSYAKTLNINLNKDLTIVLSNNQTSGRGSKGRSWTSSEGKDLLFSIVLAPKFKIEDLGFISILTPVALCETFEELDINTSIKWPNDIYIGNKKLCGILTESTTLNSSIKNLIIGIGININTDMYELNPEIRDFATSLKIHTSKYFDRSIMLSIFLKKFLKLYNDFTNKNTDYIIQKYKSNSIVLDKKVTLTYNKQSEIVHILDILENNSLLVKDFSNNIKIISSGEISLRFI